MIDTSEFGSVVLRTRSAGEADLVKGILELYGIPVLLDSDITQMLYPFGEMRLRVPNEAEDEARQILAGHLAPAVRLDA